MNADFRHDLAMPLNPIIRMYLRPSVVLVRLQTCSSEYAMFCACLIGAFSPAVSIAAQIP